MSWIRVQRLETSVECNVHIMEVWSAVVVSVVCAEVRTDSSSLGDDVNFTTLSTCSATG